MSGYRNCPCKYETPDPCPRCGATVAGNDPVNGVCQAAKFDAVVITDDMVDRACSAAMPDLAHIAPKMGGWSKDQKDRMRAALTAALIGRN